jgi:superoxide dismutase
MDANEYKEVDRKNHEEDALVRHMSNQQFEQAYEKHMQDLQNAWEMAYHVPEPTIYLDDEESL